MNLEVPWEQEHPDEEFDPLDTFSTCSLEDTCWPPLQVGDFGLPHIYLGVFSVCAMVAHLWELLTGPEHPHIKGYSLVFIGLLSCLLFTLFHFYLFTVLALTNDYEIDWEAAANRKFYAYGLWGYGAFSSFLFVIGCMVKYLGILVCHLIMFFK